VVNGWPKPHVGFYSPPAWWAPDSPALAALLKASAVDWGDPMAHRRADQVGDRWTIGFDGSVSEAGDFVVVEPGPAQSAPAPAPWAPRAPIPTPGTEHPLWAERVKALASPLRPYYDALRDDWERLRKATRTPAHLLPLPVGWEPVIDQWAELYAADPPPTFHVPRGNGRSQLSARAEGLRYFLERGVGVKLEPWQLPWLDLLGDIDRAVIRQRQARRQ